MPPLAMKEIQTFLSGWISELHQHLQYYKNSKAEGIWDAFHNITVRTLYPWDQEYLKRMPERRKDGSIFLSVASYRDENCLATLQEAYRKAKNPNNLFVGLVQQNCLHDCRSGIMEDGKSHPLPDPDPDCHQLFCGSEVGKPHCQAGRLRVLHIEEPESLGPYMARYMASKLWNGEEWYMQVGMLTVVCATLLFFLLYRCKRFSTILPHLHLFILPYLSHDPWKPRRTYGMEYINISLTVAVTFACVLTNLQMYPVLSIFFTKTFYSSWDSISLRGLNNAPSKKPVCLNEVKNIRTSVVFDPSSLTFYLYCTNFRS